MVCRARKARPTNSWSPRFSFRASSADSSSTRISRASSRNVCLYLSMLFSLARNVLLKETLPVNYLGSTATGNFSNPASPDAAAISSGIRPASLSPRPDARASRSPAHSNCKAVMSSSVAPFRSTRTPFPEASASSSSFFSSAAQMMLTSPSSRMKHSPSLCSTVTGTLSLQSAWPRIERRCIATAFSEKTNSSSTVRFPNSPSSMFGARGASRLTTRHLASFFSVLKGAILRP